MKALIAFLILFLQFSFISEAQRIVNDSGTMILHYLSPYDSSLYCITGTYGGIYFNDTVDVKYRFYGKEIIRRNEHNCYFSAYEFGGDVGIYFPDSVSLAYFGNEFYFSPGVERLMSRIVNPSEGKDMLRFKKERIHEYEGLSSRISKGDRHRVYKLHNGNILHYRSSRIRRLRNKEIGSIYFLYPSDYEFLLHYATSYNANQPFPMRLLK
jgi:hypothetical protein